MLKGMKKNEDEEHGKTLKHEAPRSINHKATQNKINTGFSLVTLISKMNHSRSTVLKRSVIKYCRGLNRFYAAALKRFVCMHTINYYY